MNKCFFGLQKIEYLGYNVSAGKIFVSTNKVEATAYDAKGSSQFRTILQLLRQFHAPF
jgi:hypothetical protein